MLLITQNEHITAQNNPEMIEKILSEANPHTRFPPLNATANKQKIISLLQFLISFLYICQSPFLFIKKFHIHYLINSKRSINLHAVTWNINSQTVIVHCIGVNIHPVRFHFIIKHNRYISLYCKYMPIFFTYR